MRYTLLPLDQLVAQLGKQALAISDEEYMKLVDLTNDLLPEHKNLEEVAEFLGKNRFTVAGHNMCVVVGKNIGICPNNTPIVVANFQPRETKKNRKKR